MGIEDVQESVRNILAGKYIANMGIKVANMAKVGDITLGPRAHWLDPFRKLIKSQEPYPFKNQILPICHYIFFYDGHKKFYKQWRAEPLNLLRKMRKSQTVSILKSNSTCSSLFFFFMMDIKIFTNGGLSWQTTKAPALGSWNFYNFNILLYYFINVIVK